MGYWIGNSSKNSDYRSGSPPTPSSSPSSGGGGGDSWMGGKKSPSGSGGGGGNSAPIATTPKGYAYTDKYGFGHVVADLLTAQQYARDATGPTSPWSDAGGNISNIFTNPGQTYDYNGAFGGGYALDSNRQRMPLPLPGAVPYGNDIRDQVGYQTVPSMSSFEQNYPRYLGGSVSTSLIPSSSAIDVTAPSLTPAQGIGVASIDHDNALAAAGINPAGLSAEEKAYIHTKLKRRGY